MNSLGAQADSFAGSFYDDLTSARFCQSTSTADLDPAGKTGREIFCLDRLLENAPLLDGSSARPVNLVDLGAGSGRKAAKVATALLAGGVPRLSYFPVDTSRYCASYALATLLGAVGPTSSESWRASASIVADFMADLGGVVDAVRSHPSHHKGVTVYALLGQTVGNYPLAQSRDLLARLGSLMGRDDMLLVDVGLRPDEGDPADREARIQQLHEAYWREAYAFMAHKADCASARFLVRYDPDSGRVDHWFARPDRSRQMLGYSQLFAREQVLNLLDGVGFELVASVSSLTEAGLVPGPECLVMMARCRLGHRR